MTSVIIERNNWGKQQNVFGQRTDESVRLGRDKNQHKIYHKGYREVKRYG